MLIAYLQAGAATEGAEPAFPPFDPTLFPSQLFWFALTFGALYFIMAFVALPKVGVVLEHRALKLRTDRENAAAKTAAAEDAKAAMEKAIAKARADARALIEDMRASTLAELGAEQAQAEARLAERADEAAAKINAARAKAIAEVDAIAKTLALDMVEKLAPASTEPTPPRAPVRMAEGETR